MARAQDGQEFQEDLEGQLAGAVALQQVQQTVSGGGHLLAEGLRIRRREFGQGALLGRAGGVLGEYGDLLLGGGVLQFDGPPDSRPVLGRDAEGSARFRARSRES